MLMDTLVYGAAAGGFLAFCWVAGGGLVKLYNDFRTKKVQEQPEQPTPIMDLIGRDNVDHNTTPKIRVGVIEAINGRILEVMVAIPHGGSHQHYDWKTEMYVVPEDQKLSEAMAVIMLMKGLEK